MTDEGTQLRPERHLVGAGVLRRTVLAGGVSALCCGPASAQTVSRGCRPSAAEAPVGGAQFDFEISPKTGQKEVDGPLGNSLHHMAGFFAVRPGVGVYDDLSEPNALTYAESFFPDSAGTVVIGRNFIDLQRQRNDDGGVALIGVLAHEFGHVFQNIMGAKAHLALRDENQKHIELHADLLAGLFLASFKRAFPAVNLRETGKTFEGMGDTEFANPNHHGTPEERVRALNFGYQAGLLHPEMKLQDALMDSIAYIRDKFPA